MCRPETRLRREQEGGTARAAWQPERCLPPTDPRSAAPSTTPGSLSTTRCSQTTSPTEPTCIAAAATPQALRRALSAARLSPRPLLNPRGCALRAGCLTVGRWDCRPVGVPAVLQRRHIRNPHYVILIAGIAVTAQLSTRPVHWVRASAAAERASSLKPPITLQQLYKEFSRSLLGGTAGARRPKPFVFHAQTVC